MPSFLSKVFGRKKEDAADRPTSPKGHKSHPSLLEGKFEAVVTPASPIATNFAEAQGHSKDKEGGFALFRAKSRPSNSPLPSNKRSEELPTLSLNLPGQKEENGSRVLGVVFEGDRQVVLDDSVIGAKRLNPTETLALVRACSQVITERGLESLGIMHPHWHSASPEIQRRLISLFIQSISKKSTSTPTPFESELKFTRSPHDVAAVLRWGLRHLKLEGSSFGKDSSEWLWYQVFSKSERAAEYPPKAFSEKLVPQLPKSHLDLLLATLEIESSLAAHAEHNSISGSKLSKFLGLWLLTASRSEASDDWDTFYARWERAGRILEHLFLCRIRDESVNHRMPTRLMELVNHYPYNKSSSSTDEQLLPRPRFSTRPYDALFVRIDTELSTSTAEKPKRDRLRLLAEAFKLDLPSEGGEYVAVWDKVKQAAVEPSDSEDSSALKDSPVLNRVFADETIRLLSLIPADGTNAPINLILPSMARPTANRRRSSSLSRIPDHKGPNGLASPNGNVTTAQAKTPTTAPQPPPVAIDWTEFTTAGFGEASTVSRHLSATLLDQDIEMTDPSVARKLSKGKRHRDASRRSSVDNPNIIKPDGASPQQAATLAASKATEVSVIQLDEAFVDFWMDAAIDPISSSWPTFVICKLNSIPGVQTNEGQPINWLVVEQTYSRPPVPRSTSPTSPGKRASSPKPSVRSDVSRMNSSLSAARKRFSFFGGSNTVSPGKVERAKSRTKISVKATMTGEMGEILPEVQEKQENTPTAKGVDMTESAGVADPGAVKAAKSEGKADTTTAKNVDAKEFAAVGGLGAVVGDAAVEKAASQTPEHTTAPTQTLPAAPENVVLSGDTPGPQIALDTIEPVASARADPSRDVSARSHAPVEDAPGPQLVSDTEPATIEPLKDQEETSPALQAVEAIPIVPALTEEPHVPEAVAKAETVKPTSPIPVAEAPVPVELALEVAPTMADGDERLGSAHEVAPEPTRDATPEPIVQSEPEPAVEAAAEPDTTPTEAAAEPIEESHPQAALAAPETLHEEVHESQPAPVDASEPSTATEPAPVESVPQEPETANKHDVAPPVEPKSEEETRNEESHIPEETS